MAIGNPVTLTSNVASKTISVTATASQTAFTVTGGYRINQLSVYRNGVRLVDSIDYTARDGATVTLLSPASNGDVLEFQVFDDFRVADALNVNSGGTINGNVTVIGTLSATNVSVAGTLTYDDVTNVDSIGIITARSGIVVNSGGINATGVITGTSFRGDGSQLTGVSAGLTLRQAGATIAGGAATTVNFASGATITSVTSGIATITIAAGLQTEAATPSSAVTTLDLSKQDHKVTATGIVTVTCFGGTEGDSHTVRIVNSGIATVGFSTYFLFPSGSPPSLPTASGSISIVSFTVHRVGTAGTQLLAGASLNFS